MFLDEREVACPSGSFIFTPAGTPHGFRVGSVPRRADESLLADIARRHSMEIVGPVPESCL